MHTAPREGFYRFRGANWRCGRLDRDLPDKMMGRRFVCCAFTAMLIVPIAGLNRRRIAPAALTVLDALRSDAGDRPIVVFGASIGSAPALHVAAHRSVVGLILHNPPALREIILRQFGWWNLWLLAGPLAAQIPRELDSVANAKAVHVPAIFLLAERDEIIAPRFQQLVVEAYAGEKRVIHLRGAQHNSPIEGAGLSDLYNALDWLLPRKNSR